MRSTELREQQAELRRCTKALHVLEAERDRSARQRSEEEARQKELTKVTWEQQLDFKKKLQLLHGCADLERLDADRIGANAELRALHSELESTKAELVEPKIELCDLKSKLRELSTALTQMTECKCIKQCVRVEAKRQEVGETLWQQKPKELQGRSLSKATRKEPSSNLGALRWRSLQSMSSP